MIKFKLLHLKNPKNPEIRGQKKENLSYRQANNVPAGGKKNIHVFITANTNTQIICNAGFVKVTYQDTFITQGLEKIRPAYGLVRNKQKICL